MLRRSEEMGGREIQMNQLVQAEAPPTLYEQHARAAEEFRQACMELAQAEQNRTQAEAQLQKVTQEMNRLLERSMQDPTQTKIAGASSR